MRAARKELGLTTSETTMIGDTMETDILGGVQLGFRTVLVLSGGTKRKDLDRYAYRPDLVVSSLAEFAERLEACGWRLNGEATTDYTDTTNKRAIYFASVPSA
jgi:NagD protein